MIIRERGRDALVQQRTTFVTTPNSWEAGIMSALGITEWASDRGHGWQNAIRTAAVACAVRLVSESIGAMTMRVYTGDALYAEPVYDASQAQLFQDPASSTGLSAFDFWSDTAAAVETYGAAFVWKARDPAPSRATAPVEELWPLDPDYFQVSGAPHDRRVHGWTDGKRVDVTGDVIVVRAWTAKPAAEGLATPDLHNQTFAWARSYEEYRGRYFDNDGSVTQVIEGAPNNRDDRVQMAKTWAATHSGPRNKGAVGFLWGGAQLKQYASTLADAQAAELATSIAMDVARAFRIVPASLMYAEQAPVREATLEMIRGQFVTFSLLHRARRIEDAFRADRDLFPDRSRYPRFDMTDFMRADLSTLGPIAHAMVQTGSLNSDEERALTFGLPAITSGAGKAYVKNPIGGTQDNLLPAPAASVTPGSGPVPEE